MVNAGHAADGHWFRIARANNRTYVMVPVPEGLEMPAIASPAALSRPLLLVALLGGAVFAATLGLWAYYGTSVFFEMVRAGWMACF
jgi:hypothetical protein